MQAVSTCCHWQACFSQLLLCAKERRWGEWRNARGVLRHRGGSLPPPCGAGALLDPWSSMLPVHCRRSSRSELCFCASLFAVKAAWAALTASLSFWEPASGSYSQTCRPCRSFSVRSRGCPPVSLAVFSFHMVWTALYEHPDCQNANRAYSMTIGLGASGCCPLYSPSFARTF